jgi:hypothetical protein
VPDVNLFVVEELFTFLIGAGIVQHPDQPPSATIPGVWKRPRTGAREPRDPETATVTLVATRIAPPSTLSDVLEQTYVDVIVRARTEQPAMLIHRKIRDLIVPEGAQGGRQQLWMMNALLVEASWIWRGEQPLPMPEDSQTFDRVASYCFECRRKALKGQPYAG